MTDMKQFTLFDFAMEDFDILAQLYGYSLCRDPLWHFFWEGKDTYIRVSYDHEEDLEAALQKYCPQQQYDVEPYEENIPITRMHLHSFIPMFHAFSELAMSTNEMDFMLVLERIFHCSLNNFRTLERVDKLADFAGNSYSAATYWESMVMSYIAHGRSFTIGISQK